MKIIILMLTLLSGGLISYSQETTQSSSLSGNSQSSPNLQLRNTEATIVSNGLGDTANLLKEIGTLNTFKYTFQSDKILETGKVDRWSVRLKQHFPQTIDLQLTSSTQFVEVTLSNTHSDHELLEIVQWFNFLNYSITE